jgi:hypothetical protein
LTSTETGQKNVVKKGNNFTANKAMKHDCKNQDSPALESLQGGLSQIAYLHELHLLPCSPVPNPFFHEPTQTVHIQPRRGLPEDSLQTEA